MTHPKRQRRQLQEGNFRPVQPLVHRKSQRPQPCLANSPRGAAGATHYHGDIFKKQKRP